MKKIAMAACMAAGLLASHLAMAAGPGLPSVSNVGGYARDLAESVDQRMDMLTEYDTRALDNITSGAAARAVLALRCENARFESVSRAVQQRMDARVGEATGQPVAAKAYARDAASMKYKAMVAANQGMSCSDLGRLREIAAENGFQD